jgi:AcrR family transcriptional regulator
MFRNAVTRATPQRAGSEETRTQILDTALTLFRQRGFDGTTIRDIATEAGLSLGAAYYYFPSKDAIVGAYYHYIQEEHHARATAAFTHATDLRARLRAAMHTKIDIVEQDRRLLRALFRYGGDPDHPLSWFGPATQKHRQLSVAVFADAVAGEKLPPDVRETAPVLLWTLHMGVLLYFLYDSSPNQKRTRRLIDAAVDFAVDGRRIVTSPLLRPIRRRAITILRDAGLLPAAAAAARA